jgi:hypothetical protein
MVHKHEVPVSPTHRHIQNPEIARALEKIRRFHAVVKASGGTTVDLVQMAAGNAETAAVGAGAPTRDTACHIQGDNMLR